MAKDYSLDKQPPQLMLRKEYARDDDWIESFLCRAQIGYVASRWDGQPFITPLTFWFDPANREIYFHTNKRGRLQANSRRHPQVCFAASHWGSLLPSNIALEFSIQYESVVAFGNLRILENEAEKQRALYGLLDKYFPDMVSGEHFRPITNQELNRTAVYAIKIKNWSGKRNWPQHADQSDEWPSLELV